MTRRRRRPTAASRQLAHFAGPLADCEVWERKDGTRRAQIRCRQCIHERSGTAIPWATRSDGVIKGEGSSMGFALDLWAEHLDRAHPGELCRWSTDPLRGKALAEADD